MPAPLCDDQEFIQIWNDGIKNGLTVREIADEIGYKEISRVFTRKCRLAAKYGENVFLQPNGSNPQSRVVSQLEMEPKPGFYLIGSDAHVWPQEWSPAMLHFVKIAQELDEEGLLRGIILNGDIFDGARVSRHPKKRWASGLPTPLEELEAVQGFLRELPRSRGDVWIWGNHEDRFDTRLAQQVPEYEGVKGLSLEDHFPTWPFYQSMWFGPSVFIKHRWHGGHHAAFNNVRFGGACIVTGHTHRLQIRYYRNLKDQLWGFETGTLADPFGPHSYWADHNPVDWHPGFGALEVGYDGEIHPHAIPITDHGTAYFRGQRRALAR